MIESIRKDELHISSNNVTISPVIINTKIEALILHSQQQEKFIKQLMNQLAFMTSQVMKQSPPVHRSEWKRSLRERLDKPQSKILSGIYKKMQTENGIILDDLQNAIYNETGRNPNAIDTIDYYESLHSIFEEWLDCLVSNVKEKSQLCEIVQ